MLKKGLQFTLQRIHCHKSRELCVYNLLWLNNVLHNFSANKVYLNFNRKNISNILTYIEGFVENGVTVPKQAEVRLAP